MNDLLVLFPACSDYKYYVEEHIECCEKLFAPLPNLLFFAFLFTLNYSDEETSIQNACFEIIRIKKSCSNLPGPL